MNTSEFIWMNGEMVPWQNATVHVMTHALHYGSSVFEGIRSYATHRGPAILRLGTHVRRLMDSAKMYRMNVPFTAEQLSVGCRQVVRDNHLSGAYIRPLIYRGYGSIGVTPPPDSPVDVAIIAFEFGAYLGSTAIEQGIDACISSWHRTNSGSIPVQSKAGGHYTNAFLIGSEARLNGYGEGIAVNPQGLVAEAAASNLFMVRDGVIYTPPIAAGILGGITRDCVVNLAKDLGYQVVSDQIPRESLYVADELFLTGTAAEITPVRSLDRISIAEGKPGPITRAIQSAFFGLFDGSTPDRHHWLDSVEN